MENKIIEAINLLGEFCGKRDLPELTTAALQNCYQITQADVLVLFGGSILCGGDLLADAIRRKLAKKYLIVGGEGHTTHTLRMQIESFLPSIQTECRSEAELFAAYLKYQHQLHVDYLETASTNCGNNITNLLQVLKEKKIPFDSIILMQDATMQRRMEAGLQKYVSPEVNIINYAVYRTKVMIKEDQMVYQNRILGMWSIEHYLSLLMGEIPRLTDDKNGYGPNGKNFIAHVDIPQEIHAAFQLLRSKYADFIRIANPLYAAKE